MPSTVTDRISGVSTSTAIKAPCRYTTTANITLSGLAVQAGGGWAEALSADDPDRIFVQNQTNAVDNGIWLAGSGTWQRARDFDGSRDVVHGTLIPVYADGAGTYAIYKLETDNPIVIGTTSLSFSPASDFALVANLANTSNPALGVALVGGAGRVVDSITDLKAVLKTSNSRVFVMGYYAKGDGGGGQYWYDSTDTTSADNGGTIIVATDGGRWKLVQQGTVSFRQFGAKLDGVTDDSTAVAAAITWGLAHNITLSLDGRAAIASRITITGNALTIVGQQAYSGITTSSSACGFVCTAAAAGITVAGCFGVNFKNILIDDGGVATTPLVLDRLRKSSWDNVYVHATNATQTACWLFTNTTANLDDASDWNTFTNCGATGDKPFVFTNSTYVAGTAVGSGGSWHNTFINTSIDCTGTGAAIDFYVCDNLCFIETFIFQFSTAVSVRWNYNSAGGGYFPNHIYFYHLQAGNGVTIAANVTNPGAIFGYDLSNGQPYPSIPNGCDMQVYAAGFNSPGNQVKRRFIANGMNIWRSDTTDGETVRDDNGYGKRVYNNNNGNAYRQRLNGTTRLYELGYSFNGSAEIVPFACDFNGPFFPLVGTTAAAANAVLNNGSSPANQLLRSTSSLRYKEQVEDISSDYYESVLNLRPIWYRSKAEADRKDWSWYGFGAEEVADIDPRLVTWSYKADDYDTVEYFVPSFVKDESGNEVEILTPYSKQVLKAGAEPFPDGVAYERIAVLLQPLVREHHEKLAELQEQILNLTETINRIQNKN